MCSLTIFSSFSSSWLSFFHFLVYTCICCSFLHRFGETNMLTGLAVLYITLILNIAELGHYQEISTDIIYSIRHPDKIIILCLWYNREKYSSGHTSKQTSKLKPSLTFAMGKELINLLRALSPVDVEFNFQTICLFAICRPLPSEMVRYAREDTHYLLYICDRLHNELIIKGNANSNLLQSVYSRSKDVCLKVCWTWITFICR